MRAFTDLPHLEASQASFYSSSAWHDGPREAIVGLIVSSINAVLWLDEQAIDALRRD